MLLESCMHGGSNSYGCSLWDLHFCSLSSFQAVVFMRAILVLVHLHTCGAGKHHHKSCLLPAMCLLWAAWPIALSISCRCSWVRLVGQRTTIPYHFSNTPPNYHFSDPATVLSAVLVEHSGKWYHLLLKAGIFFFFPVILFSVAFRGPSMWLLSLLITALGDYSVVLATEREKGGGMGWWRGKDFCGNLHLKLALSIISPCSPIVYKHFSSSFCLIRMN